MCQLRCPSLTVHGDPGVQDADTKAGLGVHLQRRGVDDALLVAVRHGDGILGDGCLARRRVRCHQYRLLSFLQHDHHNAGERQLLTVPSCTLVQLSRNHSLRCSVAAPQQRLSDARWKALYQASDGSGLERIQRERVLLRHRAVPRGVLQRACKACAAGSVRCHTPVLGLAALLRVVACTQA